MKLQKLLGLVMAIAGLGLEIWLTILVDSGDGAQSLLVRIGAPSTLLLSGIGVLGLAAGAALYVAAGSAEDGDRRAHERRDHSLRRF